ncbi:MAG: magnesium and cobalt transport protein CorA, partial [Planctomycetes bacterium]|nr:magnesium and cobalt transport protein CorA [Planctomycetota bacterium]
TVISMIFLPLAFLVGLYGMNFDVMPELRWRYGYLAFWVLVATVVTSLVVSMKRKGWL